MKCNVTLKLKSKERGYYIEMFNAKRLKRICALSQIHLNQEQGNNKIDYYIKASELNKFIRVMRQHKIIIEIC